MLIESSKLSAREVSICSRLAEVRRLLGLEQKDLAKALVISRDRLASYENFRAPIRYELGDRICATLDLNQRWFATGKLPQLHYEAVPADYFGPIQPRRLFSEVYDSILQDWLERTLKDVAALARTPIEELDLHMVSQNERRIRRSGLKPTIDPSDMLPAILTSKLQAKFEELPVELRSKFFRHVSRAIGDFPAL